MNKHVSLQALLAAALLAALLPALAVAGSPPQRADVHPQVWETLRSEGQAEVLVVLRAQADLSAASALPTKEAKGRYVYDTLRAVAEVSQRDLRAALDRQQVDYQSFYIVNALKVRADSQLVSSLAARSDVARIEPNPWLKGVPDPVPQPQEALAPQGIEANIARVGAPEVWALGYTGQGVVVAGQDTGYQWDHPALKNQYRGWNGTSASHDYNWHDAIHDSAGNPCGNDSPAPCDDHGHGTHTMGTLVGDDGAGHQIGMAPGARWIGCRNMNEGYGTPARYLECFEFFLAPYPVGGTPAAGLPALAPDVVSNSWACPPSEGCSSATLQAAVTAQRQAGIVVVVSAGNYGSSCSTVVYPPAIYAQSFTVGGFNHRDDAVYSRSSRGPVTADGSLRRKPDIAAPAVEVYSSIRGSVYGTMSGTSMAAPHVAGAVALLLSAAPGYRGQVAAIEQVLTHTAEPKTTTQGCGGDGPSQVPNNVWGWGILDALAAVEAAIEDGSLQGTVTQAGSGSPIAGASVAVDPPAAPDAITDPTGHYTLTLAADTYSVTADAVGYLPQTITNVTVISGEVTLLDLALLPAYRVYVPLVVKD